MESKKKKKSMIERLTSWQKSIFDIINSIGLNHKSHITFDDDYVIEFDDYSSNVKVTVFPKDEYSIEYLHRDGTKSIEFCYEPETIFMIF
jgi:hypothetical protein